MPAAAFAALRRASVTLYKPSNGGTTERTRSFLRIGIAHVNLYSPFDVSQPPAVKLESHANAYAPPLCGQNQAQANTTNSGVSVGTGYSIHCFWSILHWNACEGSGAISGNAARRK